MRKRVFTHISRYGHSRLENLRGIAQKFEFDGRIEYSSGGISFDDFIQKSVADGSGYDDFHAIQGGDVVQEFLDWVFKFVNALELKLINYMYCFLIVIKTHEFHDRYRFIVIFRYIKPKRELLVKIKILLHDRFFVSSSLIKVPVRIIRGIIIVRIVWIGGSVRIIILIWHIHRPRSILPHHPVRVYGSYRSHDGFQS